MTVFNEADVVRDDAGKFGEKTRSAPEVNLVTPAPPPTALDSALERLQQARRAVHDETTREIRRVAQGILGASQVVFEESDAGDGEGLYLRFSHVQDAHGEMVSVPRPTRNRLFSLGLNYSVYEAHEFMDGRDGEMNWLDAHDEGIDPISDTKAAVERAADRLHAAEPGSDHWRAADLELQATSVAAIRALTPDNISELRFGWGENGIDLVGAVTTDGIDVEPWAMPDAGIAHYDDIGWYASNITAPSTFMEPTDGPGEPRFRLPIASS